MSVVTTIKVFQDASMSDQDFAILAETLTPSYSGILYGCDPTISNATTLHVAQGWVMVRGRLITITEGDMTVSLPTSATETKYLLLTVDLANAATPVTLTLADSIPTDSSNFNETTGIAYLSIATVVIGSGGISSAVISGKMGSKSDTTLYSIATASWSTNTTTVSGVVYRTYSIPVTSVADPTPDVLIGVMEGSVLPTTAEQNAFNSIKYATIDTSTMTLTLYAELVPTSDFYIKVRGVR